MIVKFNKNKLKIKQFFGMHLIKINTSYITLFVLIQIYQFCLAEQKTASTPRPGPTNASIVSSTLSQQPQQLTTSKDEIYIDDEGIEGSGGRGEIHDDLEKETENSGSGFGPDDEDSSSNRYNPSMTDSKKMDSKNSDRRKNRIYDENNNGGDHSNSGNINTGFDADQNIRKGISTSDKGHETSNGKKSLTHNEVLMVNAKGEDRTASFFAQPGILAAVIGGAVVGLLCAILVVMFIVYRMRKKDEGSYALEEPKRSPAPNSYNKNGTNREFYA